MNRQYYYNDSLKNVAAEHLYLTEVPEQSKLPEIAYRFNPAGIPFKKSLTLYCLYS